MIRTVYLLGAVAAQTEACDNEWDCSYNGECKAGVCACEPQWKGTFCEQLNLGPVSNSSGNGLDQLHTQNLTSTWGASVLRAVDGKYHMWAAEISRHCGIHRWVTNSIIVHATSDTPLGPYERQEEVFSLFSHNPVVARAPTGEFVMFFEHYPGDASDAPTCNCTDGNSFSGEAGCASEIGAGKNKSLYSYFSWAKDPNGPWSEKVSLARLQGNPGVDMNLAPVILPDNSLLAWTRWNIWTASDWRNESTWKDAGQAPAWGNVSFWEGEDPRVWVDRKGRFHMISHAGNRGQFGTSANPSGDCGRHWFSTTGAAGTWNAAMGKNKTAMGGCAFPRVDVPFTDGTKRAFYRRERPSLVFDADGYTPVALLTGTIDAPTGPASPGWNSSTQQRDASYTLLQPIVASSSSE